MNAGKSTSLLQAAYNYREQGMHVLLITAAIDTRGPQKKISSRIGLNDKAETFFDNTDLFELIHKYNEKKKISCVFIDECQFLNQTQVWQLARVVDDLQLPVMCYGLRVDFQGNAFAGSAALLAICDEMREVKTICKCGKKATMVIRLDDEKKPVVDGEQIKIGGNDTYLSLCRKHWRQSFFGH